MLSHNKVNSKTYKQIYKTATSTTLNTPINSCTTTKLNPPLHKHSNTQIPKTSRTLIQESVRTYTASFQDVSLTGANYEMGFV